MADKQRWSELPKGRQQAIVAAGTVQVALMAAALVDIRRRPARQIRGSKRVWTAAAFLNTVGPLAYFLFGRRR